MYRQRCCHVSYLQTYLLRWCCKSTMHNYITSLEGAAISTKRTSVATYLHTYLTKKVLQKNQCITKGAAKSTNRHTAKCHLLHGFFMYSITKAAAKKKWSGTTSLHGYRLIHYILTGAAMYHQRCGKKYQRCSTRGAAKSTYQCKGVNSTGAAKVPVHYISAIAAPPPKPGSSEERNERMQLFLPEVSWSFLWNVLELGSASWSFLWNVLDCIIPKPELRRFGGCS